MRGVYSLPPIIDVFAGLWPEARLRNLLDDSLSADLAREGRLTAAMTGRKDRIMLTPVQVAACNENAVSFRRLALTHRLPWAALDQRLDEFGIVPVGGCLRSYRRNETDPLLRDEAEFRP